MTARADQIWRQNAGQVPLAVEPGGVMTARLAARHQSHRLRLAEQCGSVRVLSIVTKG